jgi:hypothetical protein
MKHMHRRVLAQLVRYGPLASLVSWVFAQQNRRLRGRLNHQRLFVIRGGTQRRSKANVPGSALLPVVASHNNAQGRGQSEGVHRRRGDSGLVKNGVDRLV